MARAGDSNSIVASNLIPLDLVNRTLEPDGGAQLPRLEALFAPDQISEFRTLYLAKQAIADEVDRLMAILDALDDDPDMEPTLANAFYDTALPALDDAEGDAADDEDSDHSGCADIDGLLEQHGAV